MSGCDSNLSLQSGETFSLMVGGPRTYYSFELYLEIRKEHEVFRPYNRGGQLKTLSICTYVCSDSNFLAIS